MNKKMIKSLQILKVQKIIKHLKMNLILKKMKIEKNLAILRKIVWIKMTSK